MTDKTKNLKVVRRGKVIGNENTTLKTIKGVVQRRKSYVK